MSNKVNIMNSMLPESSDLNPMNKNLERIPEILYKYCSFDSYGYSLQLASNGEAYFESAKNVNDPFDNYFVPTTKMTDLEGHELFAFLRDKAREHHPTASESEIQELVELGRAQHQRLRDGDPRAIDPILEVQYNRFGIFSLTAEPASLLMWAYYGDSHKGVCVGLRSAVIAQHQTDLLEQRRLIMLHKVHYSAKLPEICVDIGPGGMTDTQLHELEATLYTKSEHWRHEDEYRLIFRDQAANSYIFGTDAITKVIIGSRTSDENIAALVEQLRKEESKASVIRAVRSQSKYALEFEELL